MHTSSASSASSITLRDDSSVEGDHGPACVGECVPLFNESTALLSNADQNVVESQLSKPPKMTPVPKLQLATLCLVRLLEPIGFTQLFPYINEMLVNLDMIDDPSKVGFVSGLVVSNELTLVAFSTHGGYLIRSSAGKRVRCLSADIRLPLGQIIRCRWQASDRPHRCYRNGSHDPPLRVFPEFNLHAHYEEFTWFLCWLVTCFGFSISLNNGVITNRKHRGRSERPWRTFRSDEPSCHHADLRALLATWFRHRPHAWRGVQ